MGVEPEVAWPGHADGEAFGVGARIGGVERAVRAEDESPVHVAVDGEVGIYVLVLHAQPDVVVALLPRHEPGEGVLGLPGMVDFDLGRLPLLIRVGEVPQRGWEQVLPVAIGDEPGVGHHQVLPGEGQAQGVEPGIAQRGIQSGNDRLIQVVRLARRGQGAGQAGGGCHATPPCSHAS